MGGTGSALYAYLTHHAPIIAITLTALSLLVALTFYVLNWRINRRNLAINERRLNHLLEGREEPLTEEDIREMRRMLDQRRNQCRGCDKIA